MHQKEHTVGRKAQLIQILVLTHLNVHASPAVYLSPLFSNIIPQSANFYQTIAYICESVLK